MKNFNPKKGPQEDFMKKKIDSKTRDYSGIEKKIQKLAEKSKLSGHPIIVNTQGTTTGRFSGKLPNITEFSKRPNDYIVSVNEIYARDYLTDCQKHKISASMMRNKIILTDSECYHICLNYIYSYRDIRAIFNIPIYTHHERVTRRWVASGPNIQGIPREYCKVIK